MATNAIAPQPSCFGGWWQEAPKEPASEFSSGAISRRTNINTPTASPDFFDEKLLARDMNDLTVQTREKFYDEIHGVADIIEETPELVASSLARMRKEMAAIPKRRRRTLDRAFFLKPSLVTDDSFHLMFLRAERFDTFKAAAKMNRHFNHKLELWGEEKLVKRITLDDLDEKAMKYVQWGGVQTRMVNNRGDRSISFMAACNENVSHWLAVVRYNWYKNMEICEDEHAQKAGVVSILCFHGEWQHPVSQTINVLAKAHHILFDLPFRVVAQHLCYDKASLHGFLRIFHTLQGSDLRVHTRTHFGSEQEVQYALRSYNIILPPKSFTVGQGVHSPAYIQEYIEARRRLESDYFHSQVSPRDGSPENPLLYPSANDVLMGRGWPFQSWPGNVRFAEQIVSGYTDLYIATNKRTAKTKIAMDIVQAIKDGQGQFLERTEGGWVVVGDLSAREKTSQILRAQARARQEQGESSGKNSTNEEESSGTDVTAFEQTILDEGLADLLDEPSKRVRTG
jgi:hypothetical protein